MRITLVSLHPRPLSGEIDSLLGLGRILRRRGHNVQFIVPFDDAGLLDRSLSRVDKGPRNLAGAAVQVLLTILQVAKRSSGADVIHLALPTPAFSWVADLVQRSSIVPILVSYEGHLVPGQEMLARHSGFRNVKSYLPLWSVNNGLFGRLSRYPCSSYVVSSQYQRRELLALGVPPDRISVVASVVDTGKLRTFPQDIARQRLGLPQGAGIVGYAGHFNHVKAVDVLAQAFQRLAQEDADCHLALAWTGQGDVARVRRALRGVASRVIWLGKVHIGTFLSSLDILALPYRSTAGQSAFPALLIEALHTGCPLVTTNLPLLLEAVEVGRTALVCPPEQPDLLSGEIRKLLHSKEQRTEMSLAQRVQSDRFDPRRLVRTYEALYARLLSPAPCRSGRAA